MSVPFQFRTLDDGCQVTGVQPSLFCESDFKFETLIPSHFLFPTDATRSACRLSFANPSRRRDPLPRASQGFIPAVERVKVDSRFFEAVCATGSSRTPTRPGPRRPSRSPGGGRGAQPCSTTSSPHRGPFRPQSHWRTDCRSRTRRWCCRHRLPRGTTGELCHSPQCMARCTEAPCFTPEKPTDN